MKRHALTLAVFAAAACCYTAGWGGGAAASMAAGGLLELVFWSRLLRRAKTSPASRRAA